MLNSGDKQSKVQEWCVGPHFTQHSSDGRTLNNGYTSHAYQRLLSGEQLAKRYRRIFDKSHIVFIRWGNVCHCQSKCFTWCMDLGYELFVRFSCLSQCWPPSTLSRWGRQTKGGHGNVFWMLISSHKETLFPRNEKRGQRFNPRTPLSGNRQSCCWLCPSQSYFFPQSFELL